VSAQGPLRQLVLSWLEANARVPEDDNAPLGLSSLQLVELVEALEALLGLRIRAQEIVPEHFDTLSAVLRFLEQKTQPASPQRSS
jgi:acyl carrier protein